jgi:hypothetical protein
LKDLIWKHLNYDWLVGGNRSPNCTFN